MRAVVEVSCSLLFSGFHGVFVCFWGGGLFLLPRLLLNLWPLVLHPSPGGEGSGLPSGGVSHGPVWGRGSQQLSWGLA